VLGAALPWARTFTAKQRRAEAAAIEEVRARGAESLDHVLDTLGGEHALGPHEESVGVGLFDAAPVDPEVRRRLAVEAQAAGVPALHERLGEVDPATAARLHPNDRVRILRALEVHASTGRPLSALQREHRFRDAPFAALKIGLTLERGPLYERIDRRVDVMVADGLETEVRDLMARGYGPGLKSMQSIGYSHMAALIAGTVDRAECLRTLKRDTRRFAKRQMTWFRADPGIAWLDPGRVDEVLRRAAAFLAGGP